MPPPRTKPGDTTQPGKLSLLDDDDEGSAPTRERFGLQSAIGDGDTAPSGVTPKPDLLIDTVIRGFRIQGILGRGASGIVYRAEHESNGKRAAFKVLKPEFASDPEYVGRLIEEAKALTTIRHPGIVDIYDFGALEGGNPYLVMELCEGLSLEEKLKFQGRLSRDEALGLLIELLDALEVAHGHGIIHRDLKPSNLFLASYGNGTRRKLKVLDFGLARRAKADDRPNPTKPGTMLGTPDYMAPEQAEGRTVGPFTDVYAVGGIAFYLFTGRLPFVHPNAFAMITRKLAEPPPRMKVFEPAVTPDLDELVFRLLAKNPADRPTVPRARALFSAARTGHAGPVPSLLDGDEGESSRPTAFFDVNETQRQGPIPQEFQQPSTELEHQTPSFSPPPPPTLRGRVDLQDSNDGPATAQAMEQFRSSRGPGWWIAVLGAVIALSAAVTWLIIHS